MTDINQESGWSGQVLNEFTKEYIKERKRKRRWGIFFKSTFVLLILFSLFNLGKSRDDSKAVRAAEHTALIDVRGPIFDMSRANADSIASSLGRAYKSPGLKGIILRINSPGGSPVQADYLYTEIKRQKAKHPDIKIYAVCTDMCASAAYYIAAAADEIYANQSSMVGSIGVIFNGFGFVDTMQKVGVERRAVTSGKYKAFMDPFSARSPAQEAHLQTMLNAVHTRFGEQVKAGRGQRLKQTPEIFSGLIWTGEEAKALGLIDDFGSTGFIARERIKAPKILDYTEKTNYFEKIVKQFGQTMASSLQESFGLIGQQPLQ